MRALLIASLLCLPVLAAATPPATEAAAVGTMTQAQASAFFNHVIGTWDVLYDLYSNDGKVRHLPGQVTYTWILDGKTLQEVWSDVDGKAVKPYGTTISYLDAKRGLWTAVWVYPEASMTMQVSGSMVDGSVVMSGRDPDGGIQRWTIGAAQGDSFDGRYESSADEGKTWRILSVNHMRRHAAP